MQQDDEQQNQDWQRPAEAQSQAPYEVTPADNEVTMADDGQDKDTAEPQTANQPTEDDTTLLRWDGTEYIHHDRSVAWYAVMALVTIIFMAIAIFLIRSITFAVLIPVMAAALVIYTQRPPEQLHYILSRKGLHVNDKLFTYGQFKSFGVSSHNDVHSVVLVPRKRFQIDQVIFFPEEIGEQLVDMLAARLPMKDVKTDAIDRLLARIHL